MKRAVLVHVLLLLIVWQPATAKESPANFYSTTEIVGRTAGGFETPDNQRLTPAGVLVELPGVRPNALALSPDGRLLVTAGMTHKLIVVDPNSGRILQEIEFPNATNNLSAMAGSELVLNANVKDKLSFTGIAFSPKETRIYLSNVNGDLKVFGVGADRKVSPLFAIPLPAVNKPDRKMDIPTGLAVSRDGKRLYVCLNVSNRLLELDTATGQRLRAWDVGVAPFEVVVVGNTAYVSNWGGRRPAPDNAVGPIGRNGTVRVDHRSVASEGSVSVINLASTPQPAGSNLEILTGRHASALALSPDGKYVACANAGDDTISIIDTRQNRLVETVSARQQPGDPFGAQPDALAFDSSGTMLFACNASQNAVAVFQFKTKSKVLGLFPRFHYQPGGTRLVGLIPVGWFPGGIVYDASRRRIDVANLTHLPAQKQKAGNRKGSGTGFNSKQWFGSLSLVPVPSSAALEALTRTALANLRYPLLEQAKLPARSDRAPVPVPERVGEPSVFHHVIYFIKENRSYDQVMGDMSEGNGDADLCVFGERVTPNQHKVVREFTLLDNTYCSGIMSADGHQWADSGIATDYIERSFNTWPRSYPGGGSDAHGYDSLAYSPAGFIWNDALEHSRTVADFGEFTNPRAVWKNSGKPVANWTQMYRDFIGGSNAIAYSAEAGLEALRPCVVSNYPAFDLRVPDVVRAGLFIEQLKKYETAGSMPNLLIVWLPNDHTSGTQFGAPTPEAQVADNDLAFGRIVDAVSHSPFWKDTCIFSIEDDPQDGWDHVSGYRTTAYVASPYSKRHAVVHTQYNHTSLLRTTELILGLPPMNQLDATATPMFDCFTNAPDFTPFDAARNQVALDEMNPHPKSIKNAQLRKDALLSAKLPLDREDQCPEDLFNHILWRAVKGPGVPYPAWAVSVKQEPDDD
ncbi:MAG TPA: alkaline phosphatase family protein [Verrucomicrobiae bacterium]|nr:alkaline phosphatase family protein [Verrucomicrobiae bacterium]